jgi:hypothetical protein
LAILNSPETPNEPSCLITQKHLPRLNGILSVETI